MTVLVTQVLLPYCNFLNLLYQRLQ